MTNLVLNTHVVDISNKEKDIMAAVTINNGASDSFNLTLNLDVGTLKQSLSGGFTENPFIKALKEQLAVKLIASGKKEYFNDSDNLHDIGISLKSDFYSKEFGTKPEVVDYTAEHFEEVVVLNEHVSAIYERASGAYRLHCTKTFSMDGGNVRVDAGKVGGLITNLNSLNGLCWIAKNVLLGPNVYVEDSRIIGNGSVLDNSIIINSVIAAGKGAFIGNVIINSNLFCKNCVSSAVHLPRYANHDFMNTIIYLDKGENGINEYSDLDNTNTAGITVSRNQPFKRISSFGKSQITFVDVKGKHRRYNINGKQKVLDELTEDEYLKELGSFIKDEAVETKVQLLRKTLEAVKANAGRSYVISNFSSILLEEQKEFEFLSNNGYYRFVATYLRKENTELMKQYALLASELKQVFLDSTVGSSVQG